MCVCWGGGGALGEIRPVLLMLRGSCHSSLKGHALTSACKLRLLYCMIRHHRLWSVLLVQAIRHGFPVVHIAHQNPQKPMLIRFPLCRVTRQHRLWGPALSLQSEEAGAVCQQHGGLPSGDGPAAHTLPPVLQRYGQGPPVCCAGGKSVLTVEIHLCTPCAGGIMSGVKSVVD